MVKKRKTAQEFIEETPKSFNRQFQTKRVLKAAKTFGKGVVSGVKVIGKSPKPLRVIGRKPKTKRAKQRVQVEIKQPRMVSEPIPQQAPKLSPQRLTPQQRARQRSILIQRTKQLRDLQTLDFIKRL